MDELTAALRQMEQNNRRLIEDMHLIRTSLGPDSDFDYDRSVDAELEEM